MKQCTKCLFIKNEREFSRQEKAPDGLNYWCRKCFTEYRKLKREADPQGHKDYTNNKRAERVAWIQKIKSNTPCIDCGKIYEPYCMDYDHILEKGEKFKSVSRMVMDNIPKEIIIKEIEKCDLVCLLCHNKRTYNRFYKVLGNVRSYPPHVQRNIDIINQFKNKSCTICNSQHKHYNMQIDHIDPSTKLYDVCQLKSRKVEILMIELDKCQVLCALCHRRKSITEQQDDKYSMPRQAPAKRQELFYDHATNIKECGLCHQILAVELFRANKNTNSGLDTYCKSCFNKYRREKRKAV